MENIEIKNNIAKSKLGGGIYILTSVNITLNNFQIYNNTALEGGGIYIVET